MAVLAHRAAVEAGVEVEQWTWMEAVVEQADREVAREEDAEEEAAWRRAALGSLPLAAMEAGLAAGLRLAAAALAAARWVPALAVAERDAVREPRDAEDAKEEVAAEALPWTWTTRPARAVAGREVEAAELRIRADSEAADSEEAVLARLLLAALAEEALAGTAEGFSSRSLALLAGSNRRLKQAAEDDREEAEGSSSNNNNRECLASFLVRCSSSNSLEAIDSGIKWT